MDQSVTTVIDQELCVGCGECLRVCPSDTFSMIEGKAVVTGERCLGCGHCQAICPSEAVQVGVIDSKVLDFATFTPDDAPLDYGGFPLDQLVRLMRNRRSCRNFKPDPVDRTILEDLIRIGITAPSGSNCQLWTFTVLPDRPAVEEAARAVGDFFRKTNSMAEKAWLRKGMKLLGKPELDNYYNEHYPTVKRALQEWEETGRERLFHGAPAAIFIGSKPGGSCPAEDAVLAAGWMHLAAYSMGLGACLIGFAVEAMSHDPSMYQTLGIPSEETVYAVLALGYPDEKYRRPAGRKPLKPRYHLAGDQERGK
jgi:nitroreductase/NAD-dependent dihydropyrimidine dehydrogenase PreA subunit